MKKSKNPMVGFVITGDELVNGDILNTNGQYCCQRLLDHGITPGQQITVSDNRQQITDAINYLRKSHQAVILIGGLGPTADDCTRYGLANALKQELVFYEEAWQWLTERMSALTLTIPETNKQQALFPTGAHLLKNDNGTANACYIRQQACDFFMLPGPPRECLPIFDNAVLPHLLENDYAKPCYRQSWLLLGVSESHIAEQLEPLVNPQQAQLGYRVDYPYLEIKLHCDSEKNLENIRQQLYPYLADQIVSDCRQTTSMQLRNWLLTHKKVIVIHDKATHGLLQSTLQLPANIDYLFFNNHCQTSDISIDINGLTHYWQNKNEENMVTLAIQLAGNTTYKQVAIPYRGKRTPYYAVEMICWEILKIIS